MRRLITFENVAPAGLLRGRSITDRFFDCHGAANEAWDALMHGRSHLGSRPFDFTGPSSSLADLTKTRPMEYWL